MAANPKPTRKAVKTTSARTPGGTKVAIQTVKGKGTSYSRNSTPGYDKTGKQTGEVLSIRGADMKATKKAVRTNRAAGIDLPPKKKK
jgi:hypothetical protein